MSINMKKVAARLGAWLSGSLFGDQPLEELKTRFFTSRHIDELMGSRWRPTKLELLQTSLAAFDILREKAGEGFAIVLLKIPIKKTRLHSAAPFTMASLRALVEGEFLRGGGEPPELFLYPQRERAAVRKWATTNRVVLKAADELTATPAKLLALPIRKARLPRAAAAMTSDCLFLL